MNSDVSILVVDRRQAGGYAALRTWLGTNDKAEKAATLIPLMPYMMVATMPSGRELDKVEHVVNPFPDLASLLKMMIRRLEAVRQALGAFDRANLVFEAQLILDPEEKRTVERILGGFVEGAKHAARRQGVS